MVILLLLSWEEEEEGGLASGCVLCSYPLFTSASVQLRLLSDGRRSVRSMARRTQSRGDRREQLRAGGGGGGGGEGGVGRSGEQDDREGGRFFGFDVLSLQGHTFAVSSYFFGVLLLCVLSVEKEGEGRSEREEGSSLVDALALSSLSLFSRHKSCWSCLLVLGSKKTAPTALFCLHISVPPPHYTSIWL